MAFEVDLEELQKEETVDANKILHEYFTPKNINLKTEINAPTEFTTLDTIATHFNNLIGFGAKKRRFKKTPKTIKYWLGMYKEYMVSHGRKSRSEVGDVLKAMKQQENSERSLLQKLTGMGKQ